MHITRVYILNTIQLFHSIFIELEKGRREYRLHPWQFKYIYTILIQFETIVSNINRKKNSRNLKDVMINMI